MPRKATTANHETVFILAGVWEDLTLRLGTVAGVQQDSHAVLIGGRDGNTTTVHLAATDNEDEAQRAEKRRYAGMHDLDVVGQVHLTREQLDLTLARTSDEQRGRRQGQYSLPEGHVFLHLHRIAEQNVVCAHVVRDHHLLPAILTIADDDRNSSHKPERRGGGKPSASTGSSTTDNPAVTSNNEAL
jgi:hypothetical protein